MTKIEREKKTVKLMIEIYCEKKHKSPKGKLCGECSELLKYACERLNNCKFGENKSSCKKCPIHCYKKDMKEKIKKVMRFSRMRLLIYAPSEVIKHGFE